MTKIRFGPVEKKGVISMDMKGGKRKTELIIGMREERKGKEKVTIIFSIHGQDHILLLPFLYLLLLKG